MRIISKFRDYYDIGLSYGIDEALVYVRETKDGPHLSIPKADKIIKSMPWGLMRNSTLLNGYISPGLLGFCGRLYPIYMGGHYLREGYLNGNQDWLYKYPMFCTSKQLRRFIDTQISEKSTHKQNCEILKDCLELDIGLKDRHRWLKRPLTYRAMDEFGVESTPIELDIFHKLGTPLFIYKEFNKRTSDSNIILNPCLKDIGFASIIDPNTAFQEISMFLGGVLSRNENLPPTTGGDEVLLKAKGFDNQSFRTASPGKKYKRRQKDGQS